MEDKKTVEIELPYSLYQMVEAMARVEGLTVGQCVASLVELVIRPLSR